MISEAGLSFNLIQTGKGHARMEVGARGCQDSRVLSAGEWWRGRVEQPGSPPGSPTLERQNHARELVQGLSLSEWDGIVTVSGDGLLFEVGQGHPT